MKWISLALFLGSFSTLAALSPAQILLNAYSSQCPQTVTSAVRGSLINVQKLISVVEDIKKNSSCYSGSDFSGVFGPFHETYSNYEIYRNIRGDKLKLEQQVRKQVIAMNMPGLSETEREYLEEAIFNSQSEIIGLESEIARFNYLSKDFGLGTSQFLTSVNGFLQSWAESPQCFDKQTSNISSLISNGLMAASSFTDPGTAIALATGGVLVNSIGQFIANFKHNKLLENLSDIQMPTAVRCVSEALSNQYCDAADTLDLINTYKEEFGKDIHRFEGIDLISKHMVELRRWLTEIHAGSPISDEGEMQRRSKPFDQWVLLTKIKDHLKTYENMRRQLISTATTTVEKTEVIAGGIVGLANILKEPTLSPSTESTGSSGCYGSSCDSKVENPIFEKRSMSLLAYQIFNPAITNVPSCNSDGTPCDSFRTYVRSSGLTFSDENWIQFTSNALRIVEVTLDEVNLMRAKTISADPFQVLAGARRDTGSIGKTNAYNSLKMISKNAERVSSYLTEIACVKDPEECESGIPTIFNAYFDRIKDVQNTKAINDTILYLLKSALAHRDIANDQWPELCRTTEEKLDLTLPDIDYEIDERALKVSICISKILKLNDRGVDFFFGKVRSFVSYEVEAMVSDDKFSERIKDILYATRSDLVHSLVSTYGKEGDLPLEVVETGFETSLGITVETTDIFFETFADQIYKTLEKAKMTGNVLANLCFRLLPYAGDQKNNREFLSKIFDRCNGVTLQEYKNGPKLAWNDYVEHKKVSGRYNYVSKRGQRENYCSLRQYYLKNTIFKNRNKITD